MAKDSTSFTTLSL